MLSYETFNGVHLFMASVKPYRNERGVQNLVGHSGHVRKFKVLYLILIEGGSPADGCNLCIAVLTATECSLPQFVCKIGPDYTLHTGLVDSFKNKVLIL